MPPGNHHAVPDVGRGVISNRRHVECDNRSVLPKKPTGQVDLSRDLLTNKATLTHNRIVGQRSGVIAEHWRKPT